MSGFLNDALPPLKNLGGSDNAPADSEPSTTTNVLNGMTGGAYGILTGKTKLPNVQSIVVIVLGLLFVAAGIFAFREVRQTVISTGKSAAKVAALA